MPERVLVVGAGFTGATLAERIASGGREVLVIDRKPHVAGAAYDYVEDGVTIQSHGPHIFHTNSERVWRYLARFGRFRPIEYRVAAAVEGKLLPLPFGETALRLVYGAEADELLRRLGARYGAGARVPVTTLRKHFPELGDYVYEKIFRGYSEKHWGLALEDLPASITSRVPVVVGEQSGYFTDRYQVVPDGGYVSVITRMLAHPRIKLVLGTDYRDLPPRSSPVFYTGSPDEFFGEAGALPYRTVHFDIARVPRAVPRDYATITYPNHGTHTRITDVTCITGAHPTDSVLVTDYPSAHVPGKTEPLCPIPIPQNVARASEYDARRPPRVWFAGRLGSYQYLNMDQAIAQALALYERVKDVV